MTNEINEYEKLNILKSEIDKLKKEYKNVKDAFEIGAMTEEEKKAKGQLLLGKEYDFQKLKDKIAHEKGTYTSPKKGDWVVTKGRFGFRRVKVMQDEFCGWK